MAVMKCKMCGGALEITQGATVAECAYCGTKQTLPRLDDDRKANLYDRANHFRRNNEFDKAMGIYEQVLNEDGTDAEAYWSLVLCRYGIEYVEDPSSHKRLPTINRAQFTSIFDDDNYKSALQHADNYQKDIYEAEAKAINEIQKRILAISEKEEPFDVFVCYKETDNSGRRTPDSVLAQELYYQLTQEGFKVFFSRITLEDKLGSAYEPYIFAALNSAKVMVVLGTKPEHFKAVWVRNEWSRYLSLIKSGAKKTLIPAYKDMDPYDLPEEFSHLQAQDMSKLGFMQDLLRGIKKIIGAEDKKTTVIKETVVSSGNTNTASLLKRAFLFLEDGDWNSADEYCEKVLDVNPECAEAYLGKLMVELHVKHQDDLKDQAEPFDDNSNYQKAMRFADDALKTSLVSYIKHIRERKEAACLDRNYSEAQKIMAAAKTEKECTKAAHLFESIGDYKDSPLLAQECFKQAEICKEVAIKDAQKRKRVGIILGICAAVLALVAAFIYICDTVIIPNGKYNNAVALMDAGKYAEAISTFEALDGYKDSEDKITECILESKYIEAIALMDADQYAEAITIFEDLDDYKDSKDKASECRNIIKDIAYNNALALMDEGKYTEAISIFNTLRGYKDSSDKLTQCHAAIQASKDEEHAALMDSKYNSAVALMEAGKYTEAITAFEELNGYKDSASKIAQCETILQEIQNNAYIASMDSKYNSAIALMNAGKYSEAISAFKALNGYRESNAKIAQCETAIKEGKYNNAVALMNAGKYTEAISAFQALNGYKDSVTKITQCETAIKDGKYNNAVALMGAGKYIEAYDAFVALSGYKDSTEKANSIYDQYKAEKIRTAKVGDYVKFGAYEQDNNATNGKEEIEWLVLDVKDGKALVISRYALAFQDFNHPQASVTWETCTLRTWLNNDFMNLAFSDKENSTIPTVTVSADANPNYSTDPGNATQDKLFLLSIAEVNKYFSSNSAMICRVTAYVAAYYNTFQDQQGNCYWWLRTPGSWDGNAACVRYEDFWDSQFVECNVGKSLGVRPAMWIDLSKVS